MDRKKKKKKIFLIVDTEIVVASNTQHKIENLMNQTLMSTLFATSILRYTQKGSKRKKNFYRCYKTTLKNMKKSIHRKVHAHTISHEKKITQKFARKAEARKTHNKVSLKTLYFVSGGCGEDSPPNCLKFDFRLSEQIFEFFQIFFKKKREKIFSTDFWGWDVELPTHVASNGISTLHSTLRLKNFFWPKIVQNLLNFSKCWKCPRNCFSSIFGAGTLNFQTMKVHTVLQLFRSPWRFFWWSFFFVPNPWK